MSRLLTKQGISYTEEGKFDQAFSTFNSAIEKDPQNGDAFAGLGSLLLEYGRNHEALEVLDNAVSLNPRDPEVWYNRGIVFQRMGRLSEAENSFNEALRFNPNNRLALRGLGDILILRNDPAGAVPLYEKAISIDPLDGSAYAGLGEALFRITNYTGAEYVTSRALELYPENLRAWYVQAEIADALGKKDWVSYYNRTAEDLSEYILTMPEYSKALALHRIFAYDRAVEAYDKAVISYPKAYFIWAGRGEVLNHLGRLEESFQSYTQALRLRPNDENLKAELRKIKGMLQS